MGANVVTRAFRAWYLNVIRKRYDGRAPRDATIAAAYAAGWEAGAAAERERWENRLTLDEARAVIQAGDAHPMDCDCGACEEA